MVRIYVDVVWRRNDDAASAALFSVRVLPKRHERNTTRRRCRAVTETRISDFSLVMSHVVHACMRSRLRAL